KIVLKHFFIICFIREMLFQGNFYHSGFITVGGFGNGQRKSSTLIYPSCRKLIESRNAHFYLSGISQVNHVWNQLNFLFYLQIPFGNSQMCGGKFGPDNGTAGIRTFKKTLFAESHSVQFLIISTIHTLIANKREFQFFSDELIH